MPQSKKAVDKPKSTLKPARAIAKVGIIGAGQMGSGIAHVAALAGYTVALNDIKRVLRRPTTVSDARFDWSDDRAAERPEWIAAFLEMKTVWHPIGT